MSSKMRHGDGDDNVVIEPTDIDGTDPITSDGDDVRDVDSVGVQLIVDFLEEDPITLSVSDDVDVSDNEWTIAEFTATGLEGATIVISGSETSDGEYVIDTVASAHVFDTVTVPAQDETFSAAVTLTLVHTEDPPAGEWAVEVSNDFVPDCNGTVYGQIPNSGTWTDITSELSPAIDTVSTAGSQYAQLDITARALKYTFTPTDGLGVVSALRFAKSWS